MKKTVLVLILFQSLKLISCDCATYNNVESIEKSEVIFIGKLIEIVDDKSNLYAVNHEANRIKYFNFEVLKYYKGFGEYTEKISILNKGFNCDFDFPISSLGNVYIIYAKYLTPLDDFSMGFYHFITTSICTQSKLVSEITNPYELKIYNNDKWKFPRNSSKDVKIIPKKKSIFTEINLLFSIVILNLILTIFLKTEFVFFTLNLLSHLSKV